MWREALSVFDNVGLRAGCSDAALAAAASELDTDLPLELVELLRSTDGVFDEYGYAYGWPLAQIVSENLAHWASIELPFPRAYLAFGGDGAGDWFCMPKGGGSEIFHWMWIGSEIRPVAPNLRSFWDGWLSGDLTV